MIKGKKVLLRKIRDEDWEMFEKWGESRDALWGPYQRFQIDHLPLLKEAYQKTGLISRDGGILMIERLDDQQVVGFVRFSMLSIPDSDCPCPEIGFGVPDQSARGKGYGKEGLALLLEYLFSGYPTERIAAFTDVENIPAQNLMKRLGFQQEGVLRRSMFRDGEWRDVAIYGVLRSEWGEINGT
ncbi:MAG: N-acetyltransferase [Chloroflexi bacterium]|nr:MAG: N-acetyltransferase [Chloroflexota bacterium]MBL1197163.1 N-acetyltransferase [Chloroflexota bacterium]NOH14457.1 GNAT family N-acetyltransferase [Chloroflexota bacterium]